MSRHCIAAVSSLAIFTLSIVVSSPAKAAGTRYYHASTCQVTGGTPTFNWAGQIQNNGTADLTLWCPIITDPTVTAPNTSNWTWNGVTIDGWTDVWNPGVRANVCLAYRNGGAPTCSVISDQTTAVGLYHLTPPTPPMSGGDYLFVALALPPGSVLFGYMFHQ